MSPPTHLSVAAASERGEDLEKLDGKDVLEEGDEVVTRLESERRKTCSEAWPPRPRPPNQFSPSTDETWRDRPREIQDLTGACYPGLEPEA